MNLNSHFLDFFSRFSFSRLSHRFLTLESSSFVIDRSQIFSKLSAGFRSSFSSVLSCSLRVQCCNPFCIVLRLHHPCLVWCEYIFPYLRWDQSLLLFSLLNL